MSKKNKKKFTFTSLEMTMAQKPYYNAYSGGYGPHGSKKYKRSKVKDKMRKELKEYI